MTGQVLGAGCGNDACRSGPWLRREASWHSRADEVPACCCCSSCACCRSEFSLIDLFVLHYSVFAQHLVVRYKQHSHLRVFQHLAVTMATPPPFRIYAFGDQTYDIEGILSDLVHARNDPLLSDFLERSSGLLKREVASLNHAQVTDCPRFSKIVDLLPYWRAGTLNPALSQALTSICQLGTFLHGHGIAGEKPYPTAEDACLTGLCTGHICAAAVSCATNVVELLPLAIETVAVAFRVGACAWETGSQLVANPRPGSFPSWTAALYGINVEDLRQRIDKFVADTVSLMMNRWKQDEVSFRN